MTTKSRTELNRRVAPRAPVHLNVTLSREHGAPVAASTLDLAVHGTRITTQRPLGINERLRFDLALGGDEEPLTGRASVLREDANHVYALRFERLNSATEAKLSGFVARHLR